MDRLESDEMRAIAAAAAKFAKEKIARRLTPESSEPAAFPWEIAGEGAAAGYLTATLPEELGGAGLDTFAQVVILENLARAAAGPAAVLAFHDCAMTALAAHASHADVRGWIEKLAAGAADARPALASIAMPETVVDLDRPADPRVERAGGDGGLVVTGDFLCLVAPEFAEKVVLVLARDGAGPIAFLDAAALKAHVRGAYAGSGLEECPIARLKLDGFPVPGSAVLGAGEGAGGEAALAALRLSIAALEVGGAAQAAAEARAYAAERIQTGRPILEHQEVARILSRMDTEVEAARSMLYRAACAPAVERKTLARRTHLFCGDAAESVCLFAVQTLGGYGYMKDYGLEKRLRDVKSLQALTGSYVEDWLV